MGIIRANPAISPLMSYLVEVLRVAGITPLSNLTYGDGTTGPYYFTKKIWQLF